MLGILDLPPDIREPKKSTRSPKRGLGEDGKSICPYCLEALSNMEAEPSLRRHCPICRHGIPITILGTAPHRLNRPQRWDLLAGEMEYIWNWEHRDIGSYREHMQEFYNPDYCDAKERLVIQLRAKMEVEKLREEFLEAEGELDALIAGYLQKNRNGGGGLAGSLLQGRKWRLRAEVLSAAGASPRPTAEFQLDYVQSLNWGAFGSWESKDAVIQSLERRLEKMNEEGSGGQRAG